VLTKHVKRTKRTTGVSFTSVSIAPTKASTSLQPSPQSATRALWLAFSCRALAFAPFQRSVRFFSRGRGVSLQLVCFSEVDIHRHRPAAEKTDQWSVVSLL